MEFETQAQKECYDRVAPWVTELFGGSVLRKPDMPILGVMHGSAFAQVGVFPWGDDDAIITTRAYVVTGTALTDELMRYLLEENAGMRFGAFGIDIMKSFKNPSMLFENILIPLNISNTISHTNSQKWSDLILCHLYLPIPTKSLWSLFS